MAMRRIAATLAVLLIGCLLAVPRLLDAAGDPTDVALVIENNRFQPEEIKVKAGASFVLVITNKDKKAEEFESKDLRIEKVIPAGKTVRLKMPALKTGTYNFVGEYNESTAKGKIVAE